MRCILALVMGIILVVPVALADEAQDFVVIIKIHGGRGRGYSYIEVTDEKLFVCQRAGSGELKRFNRPTTSMERRTFLSILTSYQYQQLPEDQIYTCKSGVRINDLPTTEVFTIVKDIKNFKLVCGWGEYSTTPDVLKQLMDLSNSLTVSQ